jgi:hypothetical protein
MDTILKPKFTKSHEVVEVRTIALNAYKDRWLRWMQKRFLMVLEEGTKIDPDRFESGRDHRRWLEQFAREKGLPYEYARMVSSIIRRKEVTEDLGIGRQAYRFIEKSSRTYLQISTERHSDYLCLPLEFFDSSCVTVKRDIFLEKEGKRKWIVKIQI